MTAPIKILFDENFGEPLVTALAEFLRLYAEPVEARHLFDFAKPSEGDDTWIPRIARDGWTVITADRGMRCGGKKLPQVCRENGVTHILLSKSIHKEKQFEKIRAVVAVWPSIVAASRGDHGRRFSLRYDNSKKRVALMDLGTASAKRKLSATLGFSPKPGQHGQHGGRKRKPKPDVKGQTRFGWNADGGST